MTGGALLGLVMLVVMIGAIFIGFPISFTLLFLALAFGYFGLGGHTVFDLAYFQIIGMMKEELLAAVPLFIFMGFITEQAGLMERLFTAFRLLLAPVRGALFLVVILTATVFAMATGIVGAAVTVLGIMAAPIMIKTGYDPALSAGTITAGGTLGILIPPSVMLIVMGPVLGVSVADLYAAAFGPGFLLAGLYILYLMIRSFINPKLGPPVPKEERVHSLPTMLKEVAVGVLPLIGLITATLGTILAGWATPTEASGIGAFGALILAVAYRKATLAGLKRALLSTMATSSMVLLLAATSNVFGAVFARLGTANWITEHAARAAAAADRDAGHGDRPDLPARLAVRVAGDHPRLPADLLSGGRGAEVRPRLVRRARRGDAADGVPVAAGRDVGVLPQAGGQGLVARDDLQGHVPLHDPAGGRDRAHHHLPADRDLVPRVSAGGGAQGAGGDHQGRRPEPRAGHDGEHAGEVGRGREGARGRSRRAATSPVIPSPR